MVGRKVGDAHPTDGRLSLNAGALYCFAFGGMKGSLVLGRK